MALIVTNKKTLGETAIVYIEYKQGKTKEENIGDITIIKVEDTVVGINIKNASSHFGVQEGAHTLNAEQKLKIKDLGYTITNERKDFEIGEVISKEQHPKTDKLFVLKIMGSNEKQIVTNAANAEVGKKVVLANVGTVLPSGMAITFSKVMGVESEGMLTGGETLGKDKTNGVLLVEGNNGDEYIL